MLRFLYFYCYIHITYMRILCTVCHWGKKKSGFNEKNVCFNNIWNFENITTFICALSSIYLQLFVYVDEKHLLLPHTIFNSIPYKAISFHAHVNICTVLKIILFFIPFLCTHIFTSIFHFISFHQ